jgi:hemoglobin
MDTKKDITSRADIEQLITTFYDAVKKDDTIGFIFTDVANINWKHHIPLIVDFWESILLDNPVYTKNAMEVHYVLNKKMPLQKEHFTKWILLFCNAVDNLFEGKIAALAKTRAKSIAGLMQFKMADINKTT